MKNIVLILILFSSTLFSQVEIKSDGYTYVIDGLDTISRHLQVKEAYESSLSYSLNTGKEAKIYQPIQTVTLKDYQKQIDTFFVDVPYAVHDTTFVDVPYAVHDTITRDKPIEIDTLSIRGHSVYIDYSKGMTEPSPPIYYAMLHGIGIIPITNDTIYTWQRNFNIKRIKNWSVTTYENLEIPLHVLGIDIQEITSESVFVIVEFNSDNVLEFYASFWEVGTTEILQTSKGIENLVSPDKLKPGTEYEFQIHAKDNNQEETISDVFYFKTL